MGDRLRLRLQGRLYHQARTVQRALVGGAKDPIDTRLLAIDGSDIMRQLEISPGPVVGNILNQLLEEVLDDPARNTAEYLSRRAGEIHTGR
ncbi:MAG: hypothetical protein WKG07_13130 [Hymenobacter sp.]